MVTANNGKTTVNGLTFHRHRRLVQPADLRGRPDQQPELLGCQGQRRTLVHAGRDAARDGEPRDPACARCRARRCPRRRLPEQADRQPAPEPARRLLREPDHRLAGEAPGRRPGQLRRHARARLDHRRRRVRRRQPGRGRLVRPSSAALTWDGNQTVNDGAVIYALPAEQRRQRLPDVVQRHDRAAHRRLRPPRRRPEGFPGNINEIGGCPTGLPRRRSITQGGAIFANAYARNLQITNNVVQNNGGAYGTIRIGTPDLRRARQPATTHVRIANNRIIANAGTNLAGGIGLFAGCRRLRGRAATTSAATSRPSTAAASAVYGLSPNGSIHHNRIYFNQSYDEGGGIMIAGQLPTEPDDPVAGLRPGRHLRQPDPGQPGQRRRRRHPLPDGRQLPDERLQQHDRQQRLDPRGRRHRARRRPERAVLQQHDHEEPDDRHGRHEQRPAGPGRPVDRREQRPAAGDPAGRLADLQQPAAVQQHLLGQPGRHRLAGTVVGIGADRRRDADQPLGPRRRRRLRARWRRPTRSSSRTPATHPYTTSATNIGGEPDRRRPVRRVARRSRRGGRTRTSSARSLVGQDLPPKLLGDYHLPSAARRRPSTAAPRTRRCRATSSRRRPSRRRRPTSTAIRGRPSAASTSAPTRSRRRSPTCRSRRPTA